MQPLDSNLFQHLMNLCIALRILDDPLMVEEYSDYAHRLLKTFVHQCGQLYGNSILSINFHNLLHLVEDVKRHGTLSEFSAFKFESFNGFFTKYLRARKYPVVEFTYRYLDMVYVNQFMYEKRYVHQKWFLVGPGLENLYNITTKTCFSSCLGFFCHRQWDGFPGLWYQEIPQGQLIWGDRWPGEIIFPPGSPRMPFHRRWRHICSNTVAT